MRRLSYVTAAGAGRRCNVEVASEHYGGGGAVTVAVGSMRCSRYEALAGDGGRELLNSEAITQAIRPFNPPGEFGARHLHTLSTYANHRIRHGIRHTAARAGRRPCPAVANDRLRHMLICLHPACPVLSYHTSLV